MRHDYKDRPVEPVSSGAAYLDDAADDYISIGDPDNLSFSTGSFSVSCWVNANTVGSAVNTHSEFILGKGDNANIGVGVATGYALALHNNRTDWIFWVSDGTDRAFTNTTVQPSANQWYHLCGTFDTSGTDTARLYVNGVLIDSDEQALGDIDIANDFNIGRTAHSTYDFGGYVCNVGIWKGEALTQPQIKSIMHKDYAALSASEKEDLVSWWNLDSTVEDLGTAVYDNHGGGLGAELFTNGGFSSDSDWTKGTGWTIANGVASHDASGGAGDLTQDLSLTLGKSYRITIEITATDTTELYFTTDSGDYVQVAGSPIGVHSHVFIADESTHSVGVRGSGNWDGSVDNVSVKLVNGNTGTLA